MTRRIAGAIATLALVACQSEKSVQGPDPVRPTSHVPIAHIAGPAVGREGRVVSYSARQSSDPDGDTLTYTWVPGDGRVFPGSVWLPEAAWLYEQDGTYTASVIVTDTHGLADTASATITVVNSAPMISGIWTPAQQAVGVPAAVRVNAADSGSLDPLMITIHWGDGTSDSIAGMGLWWSDSLVHSYVGTGSYSVTATVRDDDGATGSGTSTHPVIVFDAAERKSIAGYDVFDLGTLGGNSAKPLDFNDYGKVVGSSLTASGKTHAFVWDNGVLRDLGTLGHEHSEAERINNAGLIAGTVWQRFSNDYDDGRNAIAATWLDGIGATLDSTSTVGSYAVAVNESGEIVWTVAGHEDPSAWLWSRGAWHPLGLTYGSSINEHGQIVGSSGAVYGGDSPGLIRHAFIWENGAKRDLGLLGFTPCGLYPDRNCGYASATSINESGQAVGFSTAADGSVHAVLWDHTTIRDLWTIPSVPTYSTSRVVINDQGQVAGSANGEGFFWSGGTTRSIGSLGGATDVVDMNEAGAVVGTSMTANGEQHAFVWTAERGMVDLGTGPHGFTAAWVVGISYHGDIVGYTARCDMYYHPTCMYPQDPRAIMWRKQ